MRTRISKAALLVIIAFIVPFVVEFRTVLAFFEIYLSVLETVVLGVVLIGALLLWAIQPGESGDADAA